MALTKISRSLLDTGVSDSSDATAITIDSSENVGIGVTTPFSQTQITETGWSSGAPYGTVLTVTGNNTNDANWGHLLITDSSTGTGNGGMLRFAVGSTSSDISPHSGIDGFTEGSNYGGLKFLTRPNGGTSTERMRINSSGNVGINTSSPNEKLEVAGNLTLTPSSKSNSPSASATISDINFVGRTDNTVVAKIRAIHNDNANGTDGQLTFFTADNTASAAAAERMRIDSTGNLLIGTTNVSNFPANERAITLLGSSMTISHNTSNGSGDSYVRFGRDTSVIGSITQSGNNAVAYNTTSDYRLKENVNYEFDALSRVAQLKPARFNFIADADTTVDGFIAHEVSDIVPEAITGEKDGEEMQGIDQSKLVPLLTKAIQELSAKVEELESKINE